MKTRQVLFVVFRYHPGFVTEVEPDSATERVCFLPEGLDGLLTQGRTQGLTQRRTQGLTHLHRPFNIILLVDI